MSTVGDAVRPDPHARTATAAVGELPVDGSACKFFIFYFSFVSLFSFFFKISSITFCSNVSRMLKTF
jgi:hypothetical protein